jgi:hypothetical protein
MNVLAEIADKMPTVGDTACWACLLAALACGLGIIRWWLILPFLLLVAVSNYFQWSELHEPGFGEDIYSELGYQWIIGQFAAMNLPFLVAGLIVAWGNRRYRRMVRSRNELCTKCEYDLTGNVSGICPECGERVDAQATPKR